MGNGSLGKSYLEKIVVLKLVPSEIRHRGSGIFKDSIIQKLYGVKVELWEKIPVENRSLEVGILVKS